MENLPSHSWYQHCFRRLLVDMHIPDWEDRFLAQLDAKDYAETIQTGQITSTMLYCNSHVGLALYPSKVGPVHRALKGRDFVGDVLKTCHDKGVAVVAYYSAIFNNALFLEKPEWRILPKDGESAYEESRYGVCCPNSPYREFAISQTEEICRDYPFDGIFFDMLFWPYICYCPHCRRRFKEENGHEIPTTIDWNNPVWTAFQQARERWMNEMAKALTDAVRRTRPSMTVTHQMSPVLHDWRFGMPFSLTDHCDYTSGDFYGPAIQQSLVCKLFEAISINKPFEFHTSRCMDLRDHVTMKSAVRLETQASLAPAHASAFMFIDGIDPLGTLNRGVYQRISGIFSRLARYEPTLGGDLVADVAIYMSSESRFDFRENGHDVSVYSRQADNMASLFKVPHMDAVKGAARSLQEAHIPYAVVTKQNLGRLGDYKVIILPNVLVMTDEEIDAVRAFVAQGGAVYASGYSSLVDLTGTERPNFGLAEVYGVAKEAAMQYELAFISPCDPSLAALACPQEHLSHEAGYLPIRAKDAETLATITLPWFPKKGGTVWKPTFSSIHSTPPGPTGSMPGITWHHYGNGVACYAAGAIEAEDHDINRVLFADLIIRLLGETPQVEADAARFVEITVFEKREENRFNISLVSLSDQEDALPSDGKIRVHLAHGCSPVAVRLLPEGTPVSWQWTDAGAVEFSFRDFRIFSQFELEYTTLSSS
ncbi:MAG: beta-galactosidase trimerization domain-containing protein [Chthoniobacteraceae bacterium]